MSEQVATVSARETRGRSLPLPLSDSPGTRARVALQGEVSPHGLPHAKKSSGLRPRRISTSVSPLQSLDVK